MKIDASDSACGKAILPAQSPDLPFDQRYVLAAMAAAEHMGCPAFGPVRRLLIRVLVLDGHTLKNATMHADELISAACGVKANAAMGERTIPWPAGQQMNPYVKAMYEMESGQ